MEIGNEWTVLNLGVRFRQSRAAAWENPSSLSGTFAFGLCHGTASPLGSASPVHFVGVRSGSAWTRQNGQNWWAVGWEMLTAATTETVHSSGSDGLARVSKREDDYSSAWYVRFTKEGATLKLDLFIPTGFNSPTEFDFTVQLDRAKWNRSVNNHDTYREFSAEIPFDEGLGALDSVNVFSSLPNFVTNQLRGVEWLSIRAVRLE